MGTRESVALRERGSMVIMMVRTRTHWEIRMMRQREGGGQCGIVVVLEVSFDNGGQRCQSIIALPSAVHRPSTFLGLGV